MTVYTITGTILADCVLKDNYNASDVQCYCYVYNILSWIKLYKLYTNAQKMNVWPINIQISKYPTMAISKKKKVFLKLFNVASGYKSRVMLPYEISIK